MVLEKLRYADPFYWFDLLWDRYVGKKGPLKWIADAAFTVFVAFVIYSLMGVILHTPRPAVVVASTSMLPTLHPGDVVIVRGVRPSEIEAPEVSVNVPLNFHVRPDQLGIKFLRRGIGLTYIEVGGKRFRVSKEGSIVVYYDDLRGRDIIHRVILKIRTPKGYLFVTKGDNQQTNPTADQDCLLGRCVYPFLVSEEQIIGTPIFVIPRIGMIKLFLFP